MEKLEQQFAGLYQSKENNGHETDKNSSEKEQINQNIFETITETYHDARLYEIPEPRHRVTTEIVFIGKVKAMAAASSIPLSSVITPFEGDPKKFQQWIKE